MAPVDPVAQGIPDYFSVIKHPMDFSTICQRISDGWYQETRPDATEEWDTRGEDVFGVVKDIFLIYSNCRVFNSSDSTIYRYNGKMMALTESLLRTHVRSTAVVSHRSFRAFPKWRSSSRSV